MSNLCSPCFVEASSKKRNNNHCVYQLNESRIATRGGPGALQYVRLHRYVCRSMIIVLIFDRRCFIYKTAGVTGKMDSELAASVQKTSAKSGTTCDYIAASVLLLSSDNEKLVAEVVQALRKEDFLKEKYISQLSLAGIVTSYMIAVFEML